MSCGRLAQRQASEQVAKLIGPGAHLRMDSFAFITSSGLRSVQVHTRLIKRFYLFLSTSLRLRVSSRGWGIARELPGAELIGAVRPAWARPAYNEAATSRQGTAAADPNHTAEWMLGRTSRAGLAGRAGCGGAGPAAAAPVPVVAEVLVQQALQLPQQLPHQRSHLPLQREALLSRTLLDF